MSNIVVRGLSSKWLPRLASVLATTTVCVLVGMSPAFASWQDDGNAVLVDFSDGATSSQYGAAQRSKFSSANGVEVTCKAWSQTPPYAVVVVNSTAYWTVHIRKTYTWVGSGSQTAINIRAYGSSNGTASTGTTNYYNGADAFSNVSITDGADNYWVDVSPLGDSCHAPGGSYPYWTTSDSYSQSLSSSNSPIYSTYEFNNFQDAVDMKVWSKGTGSMLVSALPTTLSYSAEAVTGGYIVDDIP